MSVDPAWLFVSLIAGAAGFVLFTYGRKQGRWPQMAGGVLLMIYPYFLSSTLAMAVVGALIGAAVWVAIRQGW
jgi:hypothetical protein